ncbi:MAG: secondary thiamine-phosphate synthase enzyme YjbQ [Eubacteriales bacterium]
MMYEFKLKTDKEGFYDITDKVFEAVKKSGKTDGICVVFCPHTTGGITINENDDPDVTKDLLYTLNKTFPKTNEHRHLEGNSHAHMKTSCVGSSETIIIEDGRLVLGTWQGIYFCEFDGPRDRRFFVKVI